MYKRQIHILSVLFGDRWREKRVLAKSPSTYVKAKSGYISAECLFLKESEGEAWLSWTSVGHYQVGDQVLLVNWANGATGGTVFSQDMFNSRVDFERVKRIFKQHVSPELSQHRLREMPDYFETDEIRSRQPTPEECVAESKKELSHRDAFRYLIAHIPRELIVSCWPLHAYFALMLAITMVFTIHYRVCLSLVLIAWGGILGTAILISLVQHRHLYFRGAERLIKSRIQFTSREVHFQMTGSYGVLAIDRFVMTEHTDDKIDFRVEDATVSSTLERKDFRSEDDWRAVLELLA